MNFKRIQWIFIIAFVLLDIGLLISIFMNAPFHSISQQQSQSQVTIKEMRNDMISFKTLSTKRPSGFYIAARDPDQWASTSRVNKLKGQNTHFDNGILVSSFTKSIKLDKHKSVKAQLNQIVNSSTIIHGHAYVFNRALSSGSQVVYTQVIKGSPILEKNGQIRFHINGDNEITGYQQGYLSHFKVLRPRSLTVSQQQAVTWLYRHNQISNNSTIRHVTFGYAQLHKDGEQSIYIPAWMVDIKSKNADSIQQLKVNAFSGSSIKLNTGN